MEDTSFITNMTENKKSTWVAFMYVAKNFLGNMKAENYQEIVAEMLQAFRKLGCRRVVEIHFLHSHVTYFPENFGRLSEEHGERFHPNMKVMEQRYQGPSS